MNICYTPKILHKLTGFAETSILSYQRGDGGCSGSRICSSAQANQSINQSLDRFWVDSNFSLFAHSVVSYSKTQHTLHLSTVS
jgi:hypothetical protein